MRIENADLMLLEEFPRTITIAASGSLQQKKVIGNIKIFGHFQQTRESFSSYFNAVAFWQQKYDAFTYVYYRHHLFNRSVDIGNFEIAI